MITVVCAWDEGQACHDANWVVAWECDRCDAEAMMELCDFHYTGAFIDGEDTLRTMYCPQCQGEVSYVAQKMSSDVEDSRINGGGSTV